MKRQEHLLPAVLLFSLIAPQAGNAAAQGRGTLQSQQTAQAPLTRLNEIARATGPALVRRRDGASGEAITADDVAAAGAYLRCQAEGVAPSPEMRKAWEGFYLRCDTAIRRFAARFASGSDMDDCAQEVWADLIRRLPDFAVDDSRGRFTSWLFTVVRSKATDLSRRQTRHVAENLSPANTADLKAAEHGPLQQLEQKSAGETVARALEELKTRSSEKSFRVLHLRLVEGRPVSEVAAEVGLTSRQIWVREHRMKKKLRELLNATEA